MYFKSLVDAPIHFVRKPDCRFSLCVDYQGLNNLTIKHWYLLPLINKSLDWFGYTKQFTSLDLTSTYYQMRICKEDKWKTAFCARYNYFKYRVILFDFSNTPASFQRYINNPLVDKLDIYMIVYLDNIFIYTYKTDYIHAVC